MTKNERRTRNLIGYESQYQDLKNLLSCTLSKGESNSVLLLGPRGVGKSRLVRLLLQELLEDEGNEGIVVRPHGLLHTNDKLALKEISKALELDNVVGDKVFGSVSEHLEFLISSLRSGERDKSKPILFILEEFHLFCEHGNQTLLYNLLDVASSKSAPYILLGISSEVDVIERLEKRVKSRFSHRQILMNYISSFESYLSIGENFLIEERGVTKKDAKAILYSTKNKLEKVFSLRRDISYLINFLSLFLFYKRQSLEFDETKALCFVSSHIEIHFDAFALESLSLLELGLLVSCKHLKSKFEENPFNFEMVTHEFTSFVIRRNFKVLPTDRSVLLKAFETLVHRELILRTDSGLKTRKEFKLYTLQISSDVLNSFIKASKTLPLDMKEWGTSDLH